MFFVLHLNLLEIFTSLTNFCTTHGRSILIVAWNCCFKLFWFVFQFKHFCEEEHEIEKKTNVSVKIKNQPAYTHHTFKRDTSESAKGV